MRSKVGRGTGTDGSGANGADGAVSVNGPPARPVFATGGEWPDAPAEVALAQLVATWSNLPRQAPPRVVVRRDSADPRVA